MSKFKAEDDVRVIKDGPYFDEAGIVRESMYRAGRIIYRVKFQNLIPAWFSEPDLTLADPDVHTVLDQMDAESAPEPNRRAQVLRTAESLVNGQRADDYGPPAENFGRIGNLWAEILGVPVRPEQVALCMAQVKIARLITSPTHEDSWIDLAGYAALGSEIAGAP